MSQNSVPPRANLHWTGLPPCFPLIHEAALPIFPTRFSVRKVVKDEIFGHLHVLGRRKRPGFGDGDLRGCDRAPRTRDDGPD